MSEPRVVHYAIAFAKNDLLGFIPIRFLEDSILPASRLPEDVFGQLEEEGEVQPSGHLNACPKRSLETEFFARFPFLERSGVKTENGVLRFLEPQLSLFFGDEHPMKDEFSKQGLSSFLSH